MPNPPQGLQRRLHAPAVPAAHRLPAGPGPRYPLRRQVLRPRRPHVLRLRRPRRPPPRFVSVSAVRSRGKDDKPRGWGGGADLDGKLAALQVGGRHGAPWRRAARAPRACGRRPVVRSRPELGFGSGPRQASEPTIAAAAAAAAAARRADEDRRESPRSVLDVSRLAAAAAGDPVGGGVGDDDDVAEWVVGDRVSETRGEAVDTVRVSGEVLANGTADGF